MYRTTETTSHHVPVTPATTYIADHYIYGHKEESNVKKWMYLKGFTLFASTEQENSRQDIDTFFCHPDYPQGRHGLSIKTQHTALKTGNLAFELEVYYEPKAAWQKSWWYSHVDYYLFKVGNDVYLTSGEFLEQYVNTCGFDRTCLNKRASGSAVHSKTRVGLISLSKLVAYKQFHKLGELASSTESVDILQGNVANFHEVEVGTPTASLADLDVTKSKRSHPRPLKKHPRPAAPILKKA